MKGLLITLAVLLILALIKVGVRVLYQQKQLQVEVLISRFKLIIVGDRKKKKKKKHKSDKKEKKPAKEKTKSAKAKASAEITDQNNKDSSKKSGQKGKLKPWIDALLTYWREILELIGRVLTSPTLDDLQLEIRVGGFDAEACAMTYGRICAIVGGVLPVVENTFGIRKRRIEVYPVFDGEKLDISADVSITLRIYEIFALAFALLGLGLKLFLEARNNKKGGANL